MTPQKTQMTPETLEALRASIAKWKENAKVERVLDAKIFSDSCPLCAIFDADGPDSLKCVGCPVMSRTGYPDCQETPWEEAANHFLNCRLLPFQDAAEDEWRFLESLLPESPKPESSQP
jgi:hypothetical protein